MGFPTPFLKLKAPNPPIGGYPRPSSTAAAKRRLTTLRCALNSENNVVCAPRAPYDHKVCVLTRSATKAASVFPGKTFTRTTDVVSTNLAIEASSFYSTNKHPLIHYIAASTYPGVTIAEQGDWEACVRASSAVVNLAGMPISTRWSPEIKREIKQSRLSVTSKVVKYINHAENADAQPSVFVSATAIGYYGTSEIHSFDESSPSGNDYLAEVRFSWIHLDDLVNLIYESLINPAYKGVINGTAPNPVRLSELCQRLGQVVGRPSWLPVPEFALKAVLGEGATVVLEGQKVLPVKAKDLGFSYRYPYVEGALKAIAQDL
nr:unnamed protein product [Digitaria exilis]